MQSFAVGGRDTPTVAPVSNAGYDEVVRFLSEDPTTNLFKLSWLDNYGICAPGRPDLFHFRSVRTDGEISGVALAITDRLMLLHTRNDDAALRLGRWYAARAYALEHVVSARRCVTPFWASYSRVSGLGARLNRNQELHVLGRERWMAAIDEPPETAHEPGLRLGRPDDVHAVFWASAAMHAEETLEDPLQRNAANFRRHVAHRVDNGRTYVWFDGHRRLLFKADVSAQSPWGAQVSGVYTPPALRGQGLATRGMWDLCHALFERGFPRVTLYVNSTNAAARRVYEKVGFEYHSAYQTVFVEQPGK